MAGTPIIARIHRENGCHVGRLANHVLHSTRPPNVNAPVGRGGKNNKADVLLLQQALNLVPTELGGANPRLMPKGEMDAATIAAIEAFQLFHFPENYNAVKKPSGRMDPEDGVIYQLKNLVGLTEKYRGGTVDFWSVRRPARLLRAKESLPDLRQAASIGRRKLESAMDHLRDMPDFTGLNAKAYRLAAFHFALDKLPPAVAVRALEAVRRAFIAVVLAVDGALVRSVPSDKPAPANADTRPIPSGGDCFAIDMDHETAMAYNPIRHLNKKPDGADPYKVYLCDGLDGKGDDYFNVTLLHEFFHMIDDETPEMTITDKGYGAAALKLPHALRMQNAENYAMYAYHAYLGRTRLVNSAPEIAALVPKDL